MRKDTSEQWEGVGQQKDRIDDLLAALSLPLSPADHIRHLSVALLEVSETLRALYINATEEDPWDCDED